jgi:NADH-quinone oxidoreductase subunit M
MQFFHDHILSIVLFIPVVAMIPLLLIPGEKKDAIRWWANVAMFLDFVASLPLVFWFAREAPDQQFKFVEQHVWIPSIGAHYFLGIDGISFLLIMLTTVLGFLSTLSSWASIQDRVKEYYAMFLLLQTGMLGVFMSLDFFLFYVFWELVLVPMYFIIGVWGGDNRLYAAIKFFIYTMFGSLLMLVAILVLYLRAGQASGVYSFAYAHLLGQVTQLGPVAWWLFAAFFLAFAIKVPLFPLHTWLPDAHVEAPTAGSVILAGVLLKMGTYGFLRFALPFFPAVALSQTVQLVIVTLSIIGIIYGGLVAMVQPDFKKLIAYSSVAHLGFVMLGIWALTLQSVQGALLIMINHGISTGALFFLVGMIYERRHSRLLEAYGGIARVVPLFAAILTIVSLSSIALPGTNGFVGEFLVLIGAFRTYPIATALATTGVIVAAAYLLTALQRVIYNPLTQHENEKLTDLSLREILVLVPLLACILWIGIYPKPILSRMEPSARALIEQLKPGSTQAQPIGSGGQQ